MKRYWFRAKKYGYGWEPSSWEGWVVMLLFIAGAIWVGVNSAEAFESGRVIEDFAAPLGLLLAILLAICWRTGEKPRWQWGNSKKN